MSLYDGRSPGQHRLWRLRCDLVLSIVLHEGEFWGAVEALRRKWGIAVRVEDPPSTARLRSPHDDPGWHDRHAANLLVRRPASVWQDDIADLMARHVPPGFRLGYTPYRSDDPRLFARNLAEQADAFRSAIGQAEGSAARLEAARERLRVMRWWTDLGPWGAFLSACVLYSPPLDRLLHFVECTPFPDPSPVVRLRDGDKADATAGWTYGELLDRLARRLRPILGIDIDALIIDTVMEMLHDERFMQEVDERFRDNPPRSYLDPTAQGVTRDSLWDAAQDHLPTESARTANRSNNRHDLEAVQAAIWRRAYGRSNQDIGARLGYTLSPGHHNAARARAAENLASKGCDILTRAGLPVALPRGRPKKSRT